jgi:hypothetical protein
MEKRIPDLELPQDVTPSEALAEFSRQCINPSSPIPIYAVILQISKRHRIKKVRFIEPEAVGVCDRAFGADSRAYYTLPSSSVSWNIGEHAFIGRTSVRYGLPRIWLNRINGENGANLDVVRLGSGAPELGRSPILLQTHSNKDNFYP